MQSCIVRGLVIYRLCPCRRLAHCRMKHPWLAAPAHEILPVVQGLILSVSELLANPVNFPPVSGTTPRRLPASCTDGRARASRQAATARSLLCPVALRLLGCVGWHGLVSKGALSRVGTRRTAPYPWPASRASAPPSSPFPARPRSRKPGGGGESGTPRVWCVLWFQGWRTVVFLPLAADALRFFSRAFSRWLPRVILSSGGVL